MNTKCDSCFKKKNNNSKYGTEKGQESEYEFIGFMQSNNSSFAFTQPLRRDQI